jgi:hypothetical protein
MADQYGSPQDQWTTGILSGYRELRGVVARVMRNSGETEWSWEVRDLDKQGVEETKEAAQQAAEQAIADALL